MQELCWQAGGAHIYLGDALDYYELWPSPTVIISDGPYGVSGYPGDPSTPTQLTEIYRPHLEAWSRLATPMTTLWFWNTELGWASVHETIESYGWEFRNCHIWDKGIAHVAGNVNGKTMRKFPVVTEVCVQYVRKAEFKVDGQLVSMQKWLRDEWLRSGLPLYKANEACGVKSAASRKYLTKDELWYPPPLEHFSALVEYANRYGQPSGRPYFSLDGVQPVSGSNWERMRAKFNFEYGITNVWRHPPVRGKERIKIGGKAVHMNQKPLALMKLCIRASSDPTDVVWEPFGGLCSGVCAAQELGRIGYAAEILPTVYQRAVNRFVALESSRSQRDLDLHQP